MTDRTDIGGDPTNVGPLKRLLVLFELPAIVLLLHGMAYVLDVPGAEVVVNEFAGSQPVAFHFFLTLAMGGLLIPFVVGVWLSWRSPSVPKNLKWEFAIILGVSYLAASAAWLFLIGMGVMNRFV